MIVKRIKLIKRKLGIVCREVLFSIKFDLSFVRTRAWLWIFNSIPDFYCLRVVTTGFLRLAGCKVPILGCYVRRPFYLDRAQNLVIGKGTFINRGLTVDGIGKVTIGAKCKIGPFCVIATTNHEGDDLHDAVASVRIGDRVWIGARAIILPGVTIGDGMIIGAGSVVTKDLLTGKVWVGTPARCLR